MNRDDAILAAQDILQTLAVGGLRPSHARLYSQHSRLRHGQPGLPSWTATEAMSRINDAALLVHAGLLLRETGSRDWRDCIRRAGELLEWLSHPDIQAESVPTRLLSAAAYGLAGLPACANALLREPPTESESQILRPFLRGDFPDALAHIRAFWEGQIEFQAGHDASESTLSEFVIQETIRALGVVCAAMRWPDESRVSAAIDKLDAIAGTLTIETDSYSWLLARLTAELVKETVAHSWRSTLVTLSQSTPSTKQVFDRYARMAFLQQRAVAWPSQEEGVRRLLSPGSFALCTPTGSGKTSVAEVAILQAIMNEIDGIVGPMCLYLVPSRALAAEVEGKLHRVLTRLTARRIVVTGLYGGTDWGPTDAWLTSDDPTVLICTYEKGEALIRFLGPLFLGRLALVVFDEAHMVQFDQNLSTLRDAESRSQRLESLGMRIRHLVGATPCRMIALSAVARGLEDALHCWVGGDPAGNPVLTSYRSTRQLIGRLECDTSGHFAMRYDILDGRSLQFTNESEATPYVLSPIPTCPPGPTNWTGVEKSLRPALLWAALHLAAADDRGSHHAVLISVMQSIGPCAVDFLQLLENTWNDYLLPHVLREPATDDERSLWERVLAVCADYFGTTSCEYRLLRYGIVVHHANMPKQLTRLLIEIVQSGLANVVLATSTLSEGVNIPIETILVPSLLRAGKLVNSSEFRNLAGRAGRPGIATEGRTLILLRPASRLRDLSLDRYRALIESLLSPAPSCSPKSPIVAAINDVWQEWRRMTQSDDEAAFLTWLETVSLPDAVKAFGSLDSLDGILLSALVEHEDIRGMSAWETSIQELWNGAFNAHRAQEFEKRAFLRRGRAIPILYPSRETRRRLYRTGLPPSTAIELLAVIDSMRQPLLLGRSYANWSADERMAFVANAVETIGRIRRFQPEAERSVWEPQLRWWLQSTGAASPDQTDVASWHKNVSRWFIYKFCWGLGSVIGASFDRLHGGVLLDTSLDQWEETGLPWIVFWLKELLSWGTLEPAAAFLLARGLAPTRPEALSAAVGYYSSSFAQNVSGARDPRAIRDWAEATFASAEPPSSSSKTRQIRVQITDASVLSLPGPVRVLPVNETMGVGWIDAAGYRIALTPNMPWNWANDEFNSIDFSLSPQEGLVRLKPYL